MSKDKRKASFGSKVRNTIILIIAAAIIFFAGLLGNIFPGLNDYRDDALEKIGYEEAVEAFAPTTTSSEVTIKGDLIIYMDSEISLNELSSIIEEEKFEHVELIDDGATQRTWEQVYTLLSSKNIAINESSIN